MGEKSTAKAHGTWLSPPFQHPCPPVLELSGPFFGEDVKTKISTKTTIIRQVQLRFRPSPMPSQGQVLRKKDVNKDEVSTGFCVLL